MGRWDINFFDTLFKEYINDEEFEDFYNAVEYMMYESFRDKLSCAFGYYLERNRRLSSNFRKLFQTINLVEDSEE